MNVKAIVDTYGTKRADGSADWSNFSDHVKKMYEKVYVFDFQPTCENLVLYIADTLIPELPSHLSLHSVKLYETATSYAEWFASDNA